MVAKNGVDWSEWGFEVYGCVPEYQGIRMRVKRKFEENVSGKDSYMKWERLLRFDRKQESDKEAVLCEEWKDYKTFLTWYEENTYQLDGEKISVSYKILNPDNHYISPETCVIVPESIARMYLGRGYGECVYNQKKALETIECKYKDKIPKAVYDRIMQSAMKEGAE